MIKGDFVKNMENEKQRMLENKEGRRRRRMNTDKDEKLLHLLFPTNYSKVARVAKI